MPISIGWSLLVLLWFRFCHFLLYIWFVRLDWKTGIECFDNTILEIYHLSLKNNSNFNQNFGTWFGCDVIASKEIYAVVLIYVIQHISLYSMSFRLWDFILQFVTWGVLIEIVFWNTNSVVSVTSMKYHLYYLHAMKCWI